MVFVTTQLVVKQKNQPIASANLILTLYRNIDDNVSWRPQNVGKKLISTGRSILSQSLPRATLMALGSHKNDDKQCKLPTVEYACETL